MNLKIGVVIGRFQVPELSAGHIQLIEHVRKGHDRVVVLLGISPVDGRCARHPLTFGQRCSLFDGSGTLVFPLIDKPSDGDWSREVDKFLTTMYPYDNIALYGGRDSFISRYHGELKVAHFIWEVPQSSGTDIRKSIKESTFPAFMRGQIFALEAQFPKVHPTVDAAVMNGKHVLLIQRADNKEWGFIGGFIDPTDTTAELAAKREITEEVGLNIEGPLEYIGSYRVDDWRYRGSRDKIMTTFFKAPFFSGHAEADKSEVLDTKWMTLAEARLIISDVHRPLLEALWKKEFNSDDPED